MVTENLLTSKQAGVMLSMPACRVKRLAKRGHIPHVSLPDGEFRFDSADLRIWVELHKQPGGAPEGVSP